MSLIIFFVDELLSSDGTHSGTFDELTSIKYQFVALSFTLKYCLNVYDYHLPSITSYKRIRRFIVYES